MDGNVVFGQNQNQVPVSDAQQESPAPVASQGVPATPQFPPQNPPPPPTAGPVSPPIPPSAMHSSSKLLKIVIGALVLLALAAVVFFLVLPNIIKKEPENVALTYWGLWEGENVFRSIISEFEQKNPTIKVTYVKQDPKEYRERLITRIQNGTGPDIFRYHNTWVTMLNDILLPIPNNIITKDEFEKTYYSVIQTDLVKNGAIYGIPLYLDNLALFVNTDIFKAAGISTPKTWEDFSSISRRLTVKDETGKIITSGAAMGTFDNITHAPDIISMLFLQNGADLKNLSQTSQNASDALSFYTSFAKDDAAVWNETLEPSVLAFAKGNLAMFFGYSWDVFSIKALNPDLPFEIHSVPGLPQRDITVASYFVEGASVKSKHQKEALLFLKFLSEKETAQKLFTEISKTRLFGQPYARRDLAERMADNPWVSPFISQAGNAMSSFFVSDTYDNGLNTKANVYLGNAVRAILGNTSPQSAVTDLSLGVTQVLTQYGEK